MQRHILYLGLILSFYCVACMPNEKTEIKIPPKVSRISTLKEVRNQETTGVQNEAINVELQSEHLRDAHQRYVHFRGVNVSGSHKAPPSEDFPSLYPLPKDQDLRDECLSTFPWDETQRAKCIPKQEVDYIGRPFPVGTEQAWFKKLASLGFNAVRLITNWESIQPYAPKDPRCVSPRFDDQCHDLDYLKYYENLIKIAKDEGIYVLIDMHQDMFSRHLVSYYQENPQIQDQTGKEIPLKDGSIEKLIFSLLPPYDDWMRGHGAPKWVVQTCLPEKEMDSPYWGLFRGWGALKTESGGLDLSALLKIQELLSVLDPNASGLPPWFDTFVDKLPKKGFKPSQTSDFLPLSPWLVSGILSLDVDRCFASLFAGDVIFPNLKVDVDGKTKSIENLDDPKKALDLKNYLQGHYENLWIKLAQIGKKYDNVIGYDIMNEPYGIFIMLAISTMVSQGKILDAKALMTNLLGDLGEKIFNALNTLQLLPLDSTPETLKEWGLEGVDLAQVLDLNQNFEPKYLQKLYERMGQAIQKEDPNAIIWFESSTGMRMLSGPSRFWDNPMTKPQGIQQLVYAPHYYPDIYPQPNVQSVPRNFQLDEWLYRDFTKPIEEEMHKSPTWLGNLPVVFGEFGTYFNFNGIENAKANGYLISGQILNAYYEAFEALNLSNMVWCVSPENENRLGDLWNREDFSVVTFNVESTDPKSVDVRGWEGFMRPYVRASARPLISQFFNSIFHEIDFSADRSQSLFHYELKLGPSSNTIPTEIFVPQMQYPNGFKVDVIYDDASDRSNPENLRFAYESETQILYVYDTSPYPLKIIIEAFDGMTESRWDAVVHQNYLWQKSIGGDEHE